MKLVVFDMDGTLLRGRTILFLAKEFDFYDEAQNLLGLEIPSRLRSQRFAGLLKGLKLEDVLGAVQRIPFTGGAEETIQEIRAQGHRTAILTDSYDVVAEYFRNKLHMDRAVGIELDINKGVLTGSVKMPVNCPRDDECRQPALCKSELMKDIAIEFGIPISETVAVGDNLVDVCMIRDAGVGIAFNPKVEQLETVADVIIKDDDLKAVLPYVLT